MCPVTVPDDHLMVNIRKLQLLFFYCDGYGVIVYKEVNIQERGRQLHINFKDEQYDVNASDYSTPYKTLDSVGGIGSNFKKKKPLLLAAPTLETTVKCNASFNQVRSFYPDRLQMAKLHLSLYDLHVDLEGGIERPYQYQIRKNDIA